MEDKATLDCNVHKEQIMYLGEKIDGVSKRVDGIEWLKESVIKSNVILEMMVEDKRKTDALVENQTIVLNQLSTAMVKVNDNLSTLNGELKDVKNQVHVLESKVEENENKSKLDTRDFIKEGLKYLMSAGVGGAIFSLIEKLPK